MKVGWRTWLKGWLSPRQVVRMRTLARRLGRPRWGNLRRTRPFSTRFGFDRGTPIDRFYLERFLAAHAGQIRGDVLEIQCDAYTRRFGRDLAAVHTVDINPAFEPTYCCDLAAADGVIPDDRYDCFLLPNTLYALRDLEGCLKQAARVVRPGGVILASTAVLGPLVDDGPDLWRMPPQGWEEVARRAWPGCEVEIAGHGNCLAAVAALLGLAHEELRGEELAVRDDRYPVLVTLCCRKPQRSGESSP